MNDTPKPEDVLTDEPVLKTDSVLVEEEVVEPVETPVHVDNMPTPPVAEEVAVDTDETPKGDFSDVAEGGVIFTATGQFVKRNGELVRR